MTKKPKVSAKREPTKDEKAANAAAIERMNGRTERLDMCVIDHGDMNISIEGAHGDEAGVSNLLFDTLASRSSGWVNHSLAQIANQAKDRGGLVEAQSLNAALAFVGAIGAEDEVEAALAQQMFAAHDLAVTMACKAKQTDSLAALNEYANIATKMMRTFTTQLEALGKHRRGGEQIVRHVHVDARNSQNIIAENVTTGGQNEKVTDQSHGPDAAVAVGAALLGTDATGYGVPVPCLEGQEAVPHARRQRRRPARQS